jgi:hypothetical protein
MEQVLQLKPISKPIKKGEKVIVLELTDIQLHMNARPTPSVGAVVQRSIEHNKQGRIFSPLPAPKLEGGDSNSIHVELPFGVNDPKLQEAVRHYQRLGYRVMLGVTQHMPIKLGRDAEEFMKSKNGKRLIRGLEKRQSKA